MKIEQGQHPVANWTWEGGAFLPEIGRENQHGPFDPEKLRGQFAIHTTPSPGEHLLVRDRLGVNKLFFALSENGEVHSSNFLFELREKGFPLNAIYSVPSGHSVSMCPARGEYRLTPHASLPFARVQAEPDAGLSSYARNIRESLERVFADLAAVLKGREVFVTLSGGLDSTTIAAMASRTLDDVTAVTFELTDESGSSREDPSGDLASARRVAEALGLPHEVIRITPDRLVGLLDPVLVWGQDWRDFNVHCGLVNAAIAEGLIDRGLGAPDGADRPVILTGDTMNELMADYHAESYGGEEHYALPRIGQARLRKSLVEGLDSGDREIGIFRHYGFDGIQPYAICAEAYAALPAEILGSDQIKQDLVREVMGDEIPSHVYDRPKVRAQVASSKGVGGTLAALVDRGVNSEKLALRFAELVGTNRQDLNGLIRGGFYRMSADLPELSPGSNGLDMHQEQGR